MDLPVDSPTTLIDDGADHLWIGSASGILRIAKTAYDKTLADHSHQMPHRLFGRIDGVIGVPIRTTMRGTPSVTETAGSGFSRPQG